jgi:bacillithiol biosynthesis cysteine-adding enzyme BshC
MDTASLKDLLAKLFKVLGPPGDNTHRLKAMITEAYLKHRTVGEATRYLVNELFGRFGLVVLDPDDRDLKTEYIPVMEDELLRSAAYPILHQQTEELGAHYKIQAYPREVNLFYLSGNIRERIERHGEQWVVLNTDIVMNKGQILNELHQFPERFSPNVMLRGLYQETIMPNVAFIGGGAEVAYWMQLKGVFEHYKGFFPMVLLRQSVMWMTEVASLLRVKTGLEIADLFEETLVLENELVASEVGTEWRTNEEASTLNTLLGILKEKAVSIDATLGPATEATLTRMKAQLSNLEKKMLRAEKRKLEVQIGRIRKLKELLFPKGSLQERVENFLEYYALYGDAWLDTLLNGTDPLCGRFLVVE